MLKSPREYLNLYVYLHMHMPVAPEECVRFLGVRAAGGCELPELNSGLLDDEEVVLTAELSLQF